MSSLLDIGPLTKPVKVRGTTIEVAGVSAQGILRLLQRFPLLRAAIVGNMGKMAMDLETILALGPEIVSAIIVAATAPEERNREKVEKMEAVALGLSIDEQGQILEVVGELTFPRGVRPFVDMLEKLAGAAEASGWGQDTKSLAASG